ncbi:MAG TPA: hypothetical protein VIV11_05460 [Kofleriaceae bacterium]
MKISFMFVAALAFASVGCKKKSGEASGDCAKAINNSMALSKAEMEKTPGMDAAMMQKMADLGVQHCKDDKWSADAIKCMTDAKAMAEAQGCYGKLTQDQQDKMNKAAMEMAMGQQGGGSAEPTGSAAGSDSAGAGSGSAAAGSAEAGSGSAGSAAPPK